jgi:hypothetical protein
MIETGAYGGTDGQLSTPYRAANPCNTGVRQVRTSCNQTSRTVWLHGSDQPIRSERAYSIHLHLRANQGGCLWFSGKLVPTRKPPSGGVTILDLEQDPIAFFPY